MGVDFKPRGCLHARLAQGGKAVEDYNKYTDEYWCMGLVTSEVQPGQCEPRVDDSRRTRCQPGICAQGRSTHQAFAGPMPSQTRRRVCMHVQARREIGAHVLVFGAPLLNRSYLAH